MVNVKLNNIKIGFQSLNKLTISFLVRFFIYATETKVARDSFRYDFFWYHRALHFKSLGMRILSV